MDTPLSETSQLIHQLVIFITIRGMILQKSGEFVQDDQKNSEKLSKFQGQYLGDRSSTSSFIFS